MCSRDMIGIRKINGINDGSDDWERLLRDTTCHQLIQRLFSARVFWQANKPNLFDPCASSTTIWEGIAFLAA